MAAYSHITPTKGMKLHFGSVVEMEAYILNENVCFLDAVFCDVFGQWHHCTYTPENCVGGQLAAGFAFDGSSIKLFSAINQSDMLMIPDYTTCWIDPFCKHKTLHVICDIYTFENKPFSRCPRQIAKNAVQVVTKLGLADTVFIGPEAEFFIFDHIRVNVSQGEIAVQLDGDEAPWKNADVSSTNVGCRLQKKQMYFPVPPIDRTMDLRSDMLLVLKDVGLIVEKHHHEVGSCQCELGFQFMNLVTTGDNLLTCKYVVKNIASIYGKSATFMPKPLDGDAGSGCHLHQSLWKQGQNLFFDENNKDMFYLSKTALRYIGGLFEHAAAVFSFTNPTTNSYKRLIPGFEAPSKLVYGEGNRSAAFRIPSVASTTSKHKRIECRFPDGASCPYLASAALLLAGLDGILNEIDPPAPCEKNMYSLMSDDLYPSVPGSLTEALDALEKDHAFLLRGDVFDEKFIFDYIRFKRDEIRQVNSVPHPIEYQLYYN